MTCSPMVRDFYDETGVPILYIDSTVQLFQQGKDLFKSMDSFHAITVGAYQIMNRLEDIPLMTGYQHSKPQSTAKFDDIFNLATQSGSVGYYFGDPDDHMSTPDIPDEARRIELAEEGVSLISAIVERMNMPHIVAQLSDLEQFQKEVWTKYPWTPAAYNKDPYNQK